MTIKQLRDRFGWTQQALSEHCNINFRRISDFERGKLAPREAELAALTSVSGVAPLVGPPRLRGAQPHPEREWLAEHRCTAENAPAPDYNGEFRLASLRRDFLMEMEWVLARPDVQSFLRETGSDSPLETLFHLLELARPNPPRFCRVSPGELGFEAHPVVQCRKPRLHLGSRLWPALVTPDWVLIPQLPVSTPAFFRLDGLLLVHKPRRTFLNFEVDGAGHDSRKDGHRTRCLVMPTLRLDEAQVLANVSLTQRLREAGYCLPD